MPESALRASIARKLVARSLMAGALSLLAAALVGLASLSLPSSALASEESCPGGSGDPAVVDWGYNLSERLGLGFDDGHEPTPATVQGLGGVRQVKAGFEFTLAETSECTLLTWGNGRQGQLGDGSFAIGSHPQAVVHAVTVKREGKDVTEEAPLGEVREVALNAQGLALLYNGTVWSWGASELGQRGNGESGWERDARSSEPAIAKPRDEAIEVQAVGEYEKQVEEEHAEHVHVVQIAVGGPRDFAVMSNGVVLAWGEDHAGWLGIPEAEAHGKCIGELHTAEPVACVKKPTPIPGLSGVERIAASEHGAYVIREGGHEVEAWGRNDQGQLGDGSTTDSSTPVKVSLSVSSPVAEISARGEYALARLANGQLYGWGVDGGWQLGIAPNPESLCGKSSHCYTTPQLNSSLNHVLQLGTGLGTSLALREELGHEKVVYAFGVNGRNGLLGLSSLEEGYATGPTAIRLPASVAAVSLSSDLATALLEGAGPEQVFTLTPGHESFTVSWHVEPEALKMRYTPVASREFSSWTELTGCNVGPGCSPVTFTGLTSQPYELVFGTAKNVEGKLEFIQRRTAVVTPEPPKGAPVNRALPSFSAAAPEEWLHEGQALTAHAGTWEVTEGGSEPTYAYQWRRCQGLGLGGSEENLGGECSVISGAEGSEYTPSSADAGHSLVLKVTASNADGSSSAFSRPELVLSTEDPTLPELPEAVKRPAISGEPLVGHTLSLVSGASKWVPVEPAADVPVLVDYWFLCKKKVEDPEQESTSETASSCHQVSSGSTYTPKSSETPVDKWVEVQEHGSNAAGTAESTSEAVKVAPSEAPVNTAAPTIAVPKEAFLEVGQTLKTTEGEWLNVPEKPESSWEDPEYQWYACRTTCVAISGETRPNYKIGSEEAGARIEVKETRSNEYGYPGTRGTTSATSAQTEAVPATEARPTNTKAPSVSGTATSGHTLTATLGSWSGASHITVTFSWRRCEVGVKKCKTIESEEVKGGEVKISHYMLQEADVGSVIITYEHALDSGGSTDAESSATGTVALGVPVNVKPPTVKGPALEGQTLEGLAGEWSSEPAHSVYSYQWLRCSRTAGECSEILGATARTYELRAADAGHTLKLRETATNGAGSGEPAVSAATSVILPVAPQDITLPKVSGTAEKGITLSAEPGAWSPEPSSYSYQWLRCSSGECADIAHATSSTYTVGAEDVGKMLAIEVRASNEGGWGAVDSAATAAVLTPTPTLTAISPSTGPAGCSSYVTIEGRYVGEATSVHVGSAAASHVEGHGENEVTAALPAGTGIQKVTVTTPYGTTATVAADEFTYREAPCITALSPAKGASAGGTSVTITGVDLSEVTGVDFGLSAALSYEVRSSTSIVASAPEGTGTVDVTLLSGASTSTTNPADRFTYQPPPTVTGLEGTHGPEVGGTIVTIKGEHLEEATAVHFGSTSASFEQISATTVKATSPAGSGTVNVTVTTPYGTTATSSADQFTYVPKPVVTGLSPTAGPLAGATVVTISGEHLEEATAVHFGSKSATHYEQISSTTLKATSPAGEGTLDVTVTTPNGTSATGSADRFSYLPQPTLTGVNPSKIPVRGAKVTITGTGFVSGLTTVKLGSYETSSVEVAKSGEELTVSAPAAAAGQIEVFVSTPGGLSAGSVHDHLTYIPVISELTPSHGPHAGGTVVKIKGEGFVSGGTTFKFGKATPTEVSCSSATECVATSPAETGNAEVVATVNGASSEKAAAVFKYE
jgi:alpha-tubulin suppressor-like RCC1 family protein